MVGKILKIEKQVGEHVDEDADPSDTDAGRDNDVRLQHERGGLTGHGVPIGARSRGAPRACRAPPEPPREPQRR